MTQPPVKCANCFYFRLGGGILTWDGQPEEQNENQFGTCHRYPPDMGDGTYMKNRPRMTNADNWCGEFKAAPSTE
jgi:hypothetical protein